jgi:hypothetical protein
MDQAMAHPVNQALGKAVEGTMAMESELMKADVSAQVAASEAAVLEQGAGQIFNAWA